MQFITVPNQRIVTIHKPLHKKGRFTTVGTLTMLDAMKRLSYSAFMLYCYLMLNADGFEQVLSPACICKNTALTKNTYHKAFHELEEAGYLVVRNNSKTQFDFYEISKTSMTHTKKEDDTYQKSVENINKQLEENKEAPAHAPEASGFAQNHSLFYDF